MTSLLVFILLSLTGTIYALPLDPATKDIIEDVTDVITEDLDDPATKGREVVTDLDVGDIIQRANTNLGLARGGPLIMFDDVAMPTGRNAVPCTRKRCLWPKKSSHVVYVPVTISTAYSREQRNTIIRGLVTFHRSTCIRFIWRRNQEDYLQLFPGSGCWSYVGRKGGAQRISLQSRGCVYQKIIQHEVLHALGFTHEQNRSDRDNHITIVNENIQQSMKNNFRKVDTNNLATAYDYDSVMHYGIYAFTKQRGLPTMVPKPDRSRPVGRAKDMSTNDIARVNKLYCSE